MRLQNKVGEVDERQLRYLYEMAAYGGIRAAADRLGINASVISRQIARMERQLGVALIEKSGRGVVLTEVGHYLVEFYRDRLKRHQALMNQLEAYRHLKQGRLTIAAGEGFLARLMDRALTRFSEQYPDILVELNCGSTAEIMTMVESGTADMGLCTGINEFDAAFRIRSFPGSPYCAVVALHHPLGQNQQIRLEELVKHRLIFLPDHFGSQRYLNRLFQEAYLNPSPSYRCNQFAAACAIAEAGLGVAFMSFEAAMSLSSTRAVAALPIVRTEMEPRLPIQLIAKVGRYFSPAASYLWRQLESTLGQPTPRR